MLFIYVSINEIPNFYKGTKKQTKHHHRLLSFFALAFEDFFPLLCLDILAFIWGFCENTSGVSALPVSSSSFIIFLMASPIYNKK